MKSVFIEDIFVEFSQCHAMHGFIGNPTDYRAVSSFYSTIQDNELFTQSQANLIIKILKKYMIEAKNHNLDYEAALINPQWKNSFRVLDLTKKIFVREDKIKQNIICLKFPYSLKDEFLKNFGLKNSSNDVSSWDHEEKIRKISAYDVNIVHLHEWASSHGFEYDEKFINLVAAAEIAWENEDEIIPHSIIFEKNVVLINSNEDADSYFEKNSIKNLEHDLLLAKFMNFPLKTGKKPETLVEKIAQSKDNVFWIKNNFDFFQLYKNVQGKICVILDRASSREDWLKKFILDSEKFGISRGEIKVCFRDSNEAKSNFNDWIKQNGLGGSVESGKLLIFENKPAKWLFRDNIDVKLIVTNNLFVSSTSWVNDWMTSHPCVIYLGELKPTLTRVKNIAVL